MLNLKNELIAGKKVLILTHMSPDGDAIGSAAALKILLEKMGISADCLLKEKAPRQYEFLSENFIVQENASENYDLIIFVDCAGKNRCDVKYPENIKTCVIDHHVSNPLDCDINIIDKDAAATGEIIFSMFISYNIPLCVKSAEAIYTAIYTDTGSFTFSNTTKKTHQITAELLEFSFDKEYIARKTMQEKSLVYSKLYAYLIDNLVFLDNNYVAIGYIPNHIYLSLNATSDDVEGLSAVLRNIIGVECGILLTEKEKGVIKGSVRTNSRYDANNLASVFSGGGHIRAAGFKTNFSFKEIKEKINEWLHINK